MKSSTGSSFNVDDGVYFLRGHFVEIDAQTLVLDQYTNEPSYKVGFNILEEIVTADEDESLYDNAQGFNNFGAPGADRLKITATLSKRELLMIQILIILYKLLRSGMEIF